MKKTNWPLGIRNWKLKRGFSLVELLVVVGIIAIMSVSSVAGFGYLGDILKTKAVAGLLGDIIRQEELKILRGDFNKATIIFLNDYIVINEEPENVTLKLSSSEDGSCAEKYKIVFDLNSSTNSANLIKKNGEGVTIDTKNVTKGTFECVEFKNSKDIEWGYQLNDSDKFSNIVRFIHFNIQRDNLNNPISITEQAGAKIEITAPYGKKLIYDAEGNLINTPTNNVILKIEDNNKNSSDTLTLQ